MRSLLYLATSTFAVLAAAAGKSNPFNTPPEGFDFTAGEPAIITWEPTTEGTVTLKIQFSSGSTPDSGTVIASNIPNSGSLSFTVPANLAAGSSYTFEIINDSDPSDINFSSGFTVDGSTGTATEITASETATGTSSTPTATDTETSTTDETSTTVTSSVPSSSDASTSSDVSTSSEASTTSDVTSSESSTSSTETSATESDEPTTTDDEDEPEETGSAPDPNGAASLKFPGGILSAVLVLMALI